MLIESHPTHPFTVLSTLSRTVNAALSPDPVREEPDFCNVFSTEMIETHLGYFWFVTRVVQGGSVYVLLNTLTPELLASHHEIF